MTNEQLPDVIWVYGNQVYSREWLDQRPSLNAVKYISAVKVQRDMLDKRAEQPSEDEALILELVRLAQEWQQKDPSSWPVQLTVDSESIRVTTYDVDTHDLSVVIEALKKYLRPQLPTTDEWYEVVKAYHDRGLDRGAVGALLDRYEDARMWEAEQGK